MDSLVFFHIFRRHGADGRHEDPVYFLFCQIADVRAPVFLENIPCPKSLLTARFHTFSLYLDGDSLTRKPNPLKKVVQKGIVSQKNSTRGMPIVTFLAAFGAAAWVLFKQKLFS